MWTMLIRRNTPTPKCFPWKEELFSTSQPISYYSLPNFIDNPVVKLV